MKIQLYHNEKKIMECNTITEVQSFISGEFMDLEWKRKDQEKFLRDIEEKGFYILENNRRVK